MLYSKNSDITGGPSSHVAKNKNKKTQKLDLYESND